MSFLSVIILLVIWVIVVSYWKFLLIFTVLGISAIIIYRSGFLLPHIEKLKKSNLVSIPTQVVYGIPVNVYEIDKAIIINSVIKDKVFFFVIYLISLLVYFVDKLVTKTGFRIAKTINSQSITLTIKEWKVKYIVPEIKEQKLVFYEFDCKLSKMKLVDLAKEPTDSNYLTLKQVSIPVKQLVTKINPQMSEFYTQISELNELEKLASSSEVFAQRAGWFQRAKLQVQSLIDDAQKIDRESRKFIREILIGAKLAKFDSDSLPDMSEWKFNFDAQFRDITDKYETLKTEISVYEEMRKNSNV